MRGAILRGPAILIPPQHHILHNNTTYYTPNTTYYTTTLHIPPQHYILHNNTTYSTPNTTYSTPTIHITQHNYIFHPNTTYSTPTLHITQHNYIFVGYPTKSVFVAFLVFNIDFRLTSRTASKLIHSLYCTVCSCSKLIFYVPRKSLRLTVMYCTMYIHRYIGTVAEEEKLPGESCWWCWCWATIVPPDWWWPA